MNLKDLARQTILQITSDPNGFGDSITFLSPGNVTATVTGLHSKHHLAYDTEGNIVSARRAHVSVAEKLLTDLAYPVRDTKGRVSLKKHRVTVKDSTGNNCNYVITETLPDETVGLIVCILGDYE